MTISNLGVSNRPSNWHRVEKYERMLGNRGQSIQMFLARTCTPFYTPLLPLERFRYAWTNAGEQIIVSQYLDRRLTVWVRVKDPQRLALLARQLHKGDVYVERGEPREAL